MVGCNEERELLLMGTGVGRVWKRISVPNSCQIECYVSLLEGKLEKSRDECPVWRSVLALLELVCLSGALNMGCRLI